MRLIPYCLSEGSAAASHIRDHTTRLCAREPSNVSTCWPSQCRLLRLLIESPPLSPLKLVSTPPPRASYKYSSASNSASGCKNSEALRVTSESASSGHSVVISTAV